MNRLIPTDSVLLENPSNEWYVTRSLLNELIPELFEAYPKQMV